MDSEPILGLVVFLPAAHRTERQRIPALYADRSLDPQRPADRPRFMDRTQTRYHFICQAGNGRNGRRRSNSGTTTWERGTTPGGICPPFGTGTDDIRWAAVTQPVERPDTSQPGKFDQRTYLPEKHIGAGIDRGG